ncbi:MAG: DUF2723 domain-containing protein [Bacteroidia bacterium]
MNYRQLNNIGGWLAFAISFIVFFMTMAPTASFWDCGEFIACSNELEVPHPPGAPFFLLLGRIFAMLAPNPEKIALFVNMLSTLASAATVLFTFWITTTFAKRMVLEKDQETPDFAQTVVILASGMVGALCCGFADSFWFSAVESEVYAMSSFFTTVVIWAMLKWEERADRPGNEKWLVLIAYLIGLSIGVHLLNLLTVPALAIMYYFKKYKFSWQGFLTAGAISIVILGVIQYGIIIFTFDIALFFEKFLVGTISSAEETGLGLPFGSGMALFMVLLVGGLIALVWYSVKTNNSLMNTAAIATIVVYFGLASYAMIPIRSGANPPIDENDPENVISFLSYMKREQYGDRPLFRGPQYTAQPTGVEETGKEYVVEKGKNKYVEVGKKIRYEYAAEDMKTLPRMWERGRYNSGPHGYYQYVTDKGPDSSPNSPGDDNPSGLDNMRFLFGYQLYHMYIRYFLWNYAGRESDVQDCAYESGLNYGRNGRMPAAIKNDASKNHYYFLPLILGILGIFWQAKKRETDAIVVGLLFFFTGIAIILYLNQYPMQPRERDYAFVGSFQTFAIWIGLGVVALYEIFYRYLKNNSAYVSAALGLVAPALLVGQNYKDHSRAGNYVSPDSAYNLLNSLEKNAVLFTNGDNDTFPLWYLQEVENVRPDVRVLCLSYVNTDWYINHMKLQMNQSPPLPITMQPKEYTGTEQQAKFFQSKTLNVDLPADKDALLKAGILNEKEAATVESPMKWTIKTRKEGGGNLLMLADLLIKNLIENVAKQGWTRPIYFANTVSPSSFVGLDNNLRQEGLAYRVLPIKATSRPDRYDPFTGTVRQDLTFEALTKKFKYRGLADNSVYYDENIRRMIGNYYNTFYRLANSYFTEAEDLTNPQPQPIPNPNNPNELIMPPPTSDVKVATPEAKQQAEALMAKAKETMAHAEKAFPYTVAQPDAYYLVKFGIMFDKLGDKAKADQYFKAAREATIPIIDYYSQENLYNGRESEDLLALRLLGDYLRNVKKDKKAADDFENSISPRVRARMMGEMQMDGAE